MPSCRKQASSMMSFAFTFAFIFGLVPFVLASGQGAATQKAVAMPDLVRAHHIGMIRNRIMRNG
jgi:nucleoid-associated protein YgaU